VTPYPVQLSVDKPAHYSRLQLLLRVLGFIVIGMLGLSLGLIAIVAYLALPAFAAARLAGDRDERASYLETDGPRITRALSWFAAIYAWFGLVVDRLPSKTPAETVRLAIEPAAARTAEPTPATALWRLLWGLPSALVLMLLYFFGSFVWLWSALRVLFSERVGDVAHGYLTGLQRWTIRLLAYQASLVEPYPPLSLAEGPRLPTATAVRQSG
jgi:hypothetical protein